ncbi:STAS domain-containing protein [Calothrix rhizosoleniae]|uniref:STAS domain-containing protein n=1 Tax=Calothrix rhizosoleniae TaxID=888997 RepID=UPI000B49FF12|nr:STAS domain-containing protein [Calothrix rhizosoleniae]
MDQDKTQVIKPSGILDATTSQELRSQITECVDNGIKIILVDFADVTFMDSSGLGALVLAFKGLRAAENQLFICSVNEQIKILFELTGMDKVFTIFANQDQFYQSVLSRS